MIIPIICTVYNANGEIAYYEVRDKATGKLLWEPTQQEYNMRLDEANDILAAVERQRSYLGGYSKAIIKAAIRIVLYRRASTKDEISRARTVQSWVLNSPSTSTQQEQQQ